MAAELSDSSTKNEPAWSPTERPEPHTDPANKPLVANEQEYDTDIRDGEDDGLVHRSGNPIWSLFAWEFLAFILSTALLIAIIGILAHYNHQPQPNWDRVSLNSVISWLSTLSKACVIFCISEGLGQLKWVWFAQKRRPISDLQDFDSASRGIWGSLRLIWSLRARHFAASASLAVVLAIAFDPFMQNLIRYYPKLVVDGSETALTARGDRYDNYGVPSHHMTYVDTAMKANVYNSLFNTDPTKPWSTPKYTCSTGNCTWDPMIAIQWDFKLLVEPFSTPIVIGSGLPLVYTNSSLEAIMGPIQMIGPDSLVSSKNHSYSRKTKWQAIECIIYPVARSFRASVTSGVYHEETLGVWEDIDSLVIDQKTGYFSFKPPWGPEMGMQNNQSLEIGYSASDSMRAFYKFLLDGKVFVDPWGPQYETNSEAIYATVDAVQAVAHADIIDCPYDTVQKLECAMKNMAQAMTKTFRDDGVTALSSSTNNTQAVGKAMSNMTYVSVRWQWIVLPALVWLLGLVTIIVTTSKTRRYRAPVWKNGIMPLFDLHGNYQHKMIRQVSGQGEIIRV
ncbi:hypothetical protein N7509_009499 [Penicillium cosmopolitanum]|uniref:Uncharacterized protein n=1 Tax=Penicillium cosmopolitanum TaxID=1131564 RepID=A0A9X0B3N4_9EURO|nr:uncharacterized protein N7509_009499 [Penicillium cosmopolitanum]KAJ5386958.1 hypothetical protein N7509_009499 [Penicillium cosmopolitanum]